MKTVEDNHTEKKRPTNWSASKDTRTVIFQLIN